MLFVAGLGIIFICTCFASCSVAVLFHWLRRERRLRPTKSNLIRDAIVISTSLIILLSAGLLQVLLWSVFFVYIGEFESLHRAYYFALVSYTTLGYGDIVLSEDAAILGPLAAAHGSIMMGVSTSILIWLTSTLVKERSKLFQKSDE